MRIAIFGAGIGGLTVAHKLANFSDLYDIVIYDVKNVVGGLARSEGKACNTREISWRVFFDLYKYLPEVLKSIPTDDGRNVYDHLIPYSNLTLPSQTPRDLAMIGYHICRVVTACDARLNTWDDDTWFDKMNTKDKLSIPQWLGVDRYKGSYLTVARIGIEQFMLGNPSKSLVLDGPTSEVWFNPWVIYLKSLGVEFRFNTPLAHISENKGIQTHLEGGERVKADIYVLCLPVEELARVASDIVPNAAALSQKGRQIQLAFQLYLKDDLSFGSTNGQCVLSILLANSPWGIIIEAKNISWSTKCAPWSVTVCQANTPGIVTGKPMIRCSREEAQSEVLAQMEHDKLFMTLLKEENEFFDGIKVEKWNTMSDTYFFSPGGMQTTEPKFSNNAGTKCLRPSFKIKNEVYISTAYVQETLDIFSMEAAAMAGHFVFADITQTASPTLRDRPLKCLFAPIRSLDCVLFSIGGPHVLNVIFFLIIMFLIIYVTI